jgi:hypothetical protein
VVLAKANALNTREKTPYTLISKQWGCCKTAKIAVATTPFFADELLTLNLTIKCPSLNK